MIKIDLLQHHTYTIPSLARLWHEVLGKIWFPELEVQAIESLTYDELKHPHAITSFVALYDDIPVGFCTFKLKEDFHPDLGPWLSDLVVGPRYQKQGISKMLIHVALQKASERAKL
jgi:GNAT superfamily N-acetyltransferase